MNVIKSVRDYVSKMVKLAPGMKVLLLDAETAGIVSMAYSQSDILQEEVYLFERLDTPNREVMAHLKAVVFLRPTEDNLALLKSELRKPKYGEYYLFFSNAVGNTFLEQLAAADEHEVVQEVNEFFADYFAVNPDLFSLNIVRCLSPRTDRWREKLNRMCDGIISCCLSMRLKPLVRFARSSEVTMQIAQELNTRMRSQKSLFSNLRQNPAVVLILDRKDDPVTPLLLQWTYQAMVHDHLGIQNNRVELAKGADGKKEQLVLSEQDPFYRENMYKNFGDLGVAIKDLVDQYKEKMQINQNIASIEDMKHFVEQYPEFKKLSGNVSKHVKIVEELQRQIQKRQLLVVSELEQELSSHHGHADALSKVKQLLEDSHVSGEDALRLVLLYSLRYESTANNELSLLVTALASKKNLSPSVLAIFKQLRDYAGEKRRSMDIDLFKNKNLLDIARGQIKRGLMGVTNIYSQNESLIKRVLNDVQAGTLSEVAFPYVESPASKDRPTEVIIFVTGGTCFEEAVAVNEFNARNTGISVVLGGNTIHNYKSFIEEVMDYK